ncbi:glycosyltransferase [Paraliobacillus sediminis]|uniref:glycosyltransferase n=1 Tax=Paraliobacillus sediminis TaxID=1885916 RepID=UPI001F083FE5|nr:glycosyltransferase [Paraliobacillus sediminis]
MRHAKERVLVISTMYPSKENKTFGIFVKNQVEAIRQQGILVDVVAIKEPRMGKTMLIKKYTKWFLQTAGYFIRNGRRYTTVHAHYTFPSGWLGLWFKRVFKAKLLVTVHGGDIDKMARINSFLYKQTKRVLHAADEVIVVGEGLRQAVEGEFQVDPSKISVLNMGVNRNIFQPRDKEKMKKELGIPSSHKVILYVGNLIKAKGLQELVMAFKDLKQEDDDLHLHLIGANKEPNFLIFIKQLIHDEDIKGINFHDVKTQTEVAKWMAACETFVLPSYIEGFGLVALEAMACHTPVVGSDVGGLHYLLDQEAGLRVAPQDVKALQQGLRQVLSDKALRQILIYNGDKKALENEQQRLIDSLITLYRR